MPKQTIITGHDRSTVRKAISRRTKPKRSLINDRACWRCKRYKKACDDELICSACLTGGFRIWPSSLGCRRGNLHHLAQSLIPDNIDVLGPLLSHNPVRLPSWRQIPQAWIDDIPVPDILGTSDMWDMLLHLLKATNIHGPGLLELVIIAAHYHRSMPRKSPTLARAARLLILVLRLYHACIETDFESSTTDSSGILAHFAMMRQATIEFFDDFMQECLAGRLKQWPSTFLAVCLGIIASVLHIDIIAVLPDEVRSLVWIDFRQYIASLRSVLYSSFLDLLSVLGKHSPLLEMSCWQKADADDADKDAGSSPLPQASTRNVEGMRIMEDDEKAFDAMVALVTWRQQFLPFLRGDLWMKLSFFEADLLPIMSLSRMFLSTTDAEMQIDVVPIHKFTERSPILT